MPRYRLRMEYDGTGFCGWQAQPAGCGVQNHLQAAVQAFAQEEVACVAAGRTDAGVHALGQVVHFDLAASPPPARLRAGLNFYLRAVPAVVLEAERAAPDFDARFQARRRHYRYEMVLRASRLALWRARAWQVARPLNLAAMQEAAALLVGRHDFTTFRAAHCQAASPCKTLRQLTVEQRGERLRITAAARSFLQHQMRSMVGALKHVGEGKWTPARLAAALQARDRALCPPLAPPHGLYFVRADYASDGAADESQAAEK